MKGITLRDDVHGRDARIAGAGDGLHGGGHDARDAERLERRKPHGQHDRRTVRVGGDGALPAARGFCNGISFKWSGLISGISSGTSGSMR